MSTVTVTLRLEPIAAAGLKRFAEKVSHEQARSVLYAHVAATIRDNQSHDILVALDALDRALSDAGVRSWPWVETGNVGALSVMGNPI